MVDVLRRATWILIANGSRARVFSAPGAGRRWTLVRELEHPESRAKTSDLVTDDRGRVRQSASGPRSAMEPEVAPKRVEAMRFARQLVKVLERGLEDGAYEQLIVVVPPRLLGLLRRRLSKNVAARIGLVFEKDYTSLEPLEIQTQIAA